MTQTLTICNGTINSGGYCDKCYQPSQTTSNACGRFVLMQSVSTKQKTAIRQLIERLEEYELGVDFAISVARSLESVNEQQIKDAFVSGYGSGANRKSTSDDKYMDETFEKP